MNFIIEVADKVLNGGEVTRAEAERLINASDDDTMLLLAMADKIRQKYNGNAVDCCAIINGRSGRCPENCKFCAQSAHYHTGVKEYPLLSEQEFVDAAKKAKAAGAVRFSIVTSGRGQSKADDFDNICKALKRIKEEVGIEVCCSLGILTEEQAFKLKELGVFGNDYDTPDGTGVRDYIHVVDLAKGHVKALKKIEENPGLAIYNLGTGKGYSVLDIVKNFEAATGVKIPYAIKPRRAGDIATCYCDASKAAKELGWTAENGIREMCEDSWRWQSNNPNGYEDE